MEASEADALIQAARKVLEHRGGAGFTVHEVLSEAGLGTRAFYRHFAAKEALVLAVFADASAQEEARLRERMQGAPSALHAIVAWIDGRLELAFDEQMALSMRALSLEAEKAGRQLPEPLVAALDRMLTPLVEQLQKAQREGLSTGTDPVSESRSVHDVVWGETVRQWWGVGPDRASARAHVLHFCFQAIGAELPTD